MNKYFDLVIDLLELEHQEELKGLAMTLAEERKQGKNVIIFHRYDFLFYAWLLFLEGKLTEEEFVQIGDVDSEVRIYNKNKKHLIAFLTELMNGKLPNEDIIVVDQDGWRLFLTEKEQKELEEKITHAHKKLYFLI